jgi:hypothetical protein
MQKKINTNKPQFDLRTHIRNGKGKIERENHYRLYIENGVQKFERPPGSKIFYDASGALLSKPADKDLPIEQPVDAEAKIAELEAKLKALETKATEEDKTVHVTVDDVKVDDVKVEAQTDLSEEIALMEKAGATTEASQLKQKQKPMFDKFAR